MSILTPEEIIAEIRRVYGVRPPPQRLEAPRVTMVNENLYGVAILVYGEGVRGQLLRYSMYERDGVRYWIIEYGWTTIYGETIDGHILPLTILGLPTTFVRSYSPRDFRRFLVEEVPVDYLECREDQIINLERVMKGLDPIMVIDKYDVLRFARDSDAMERIMEYAAVIEQQQRALAQYERSIHDYRTTIRTLQARLAKYQELIRSYEDRLVKLSTEVTSIQAELLRLRDEMKVRGIEIEVAEESLQRLQDLVDRLRSMIEELSRLREETKGAGGGAR